MNYQIGLKQHAPVRPRAYLFHGSIHAVHIAVKGYICYRTYLATFAFSTQIATDGLTLEVLDRTALAPQCRSPWAWTIYILPHAAAAHPPPLFNLGGFSAGARTRYLADTRETVVITLYSGSQQIPTACQKGALIPGSPREA